MAMEIAYGYMFYECIIAEKPYLERIERQRAYNANKEPVNVKGEAENNAIIFIFFLYFRSRL